MGTPERRIVWGVFFILIIGYGFTWWFRWHRRTDLNLFHNITWLRILVEVAVLVAIPRLIRRALRSEIVRSSGEFPDIDMDWTAGMTAMMEKAIPIESRPLFLIAGISIHELQRSMMKVFKGMKVEAVPASTNGQHSLQWYVTDDATYLFLCDVGLEDVASLESLSKSGAYSVGGSGTSGMTLAASHPSFESPADSPFNEISSEAGGGKNVGLLQRRVAYVGQHIRRFRAPWCGINGLLFFVPAGAFRSMGSAEGLAEVVSKTTQALSDTLSLNFPVSVALHDVDQVHGFGEFVAQIRERDSAALEQRLGQGFNLNKLPFPDLLGTKVDGTGSGGIESNVSEEIVRSLEKMVYRLLARGEGRNQPSMLERPIESRRLFEFFVQARSEIRPRLSRFLRTAFGAENQETAPYFSGCYLTSLTHEHPAFLKGLLDDKLLGEQHFVQWYPKEKNRNLLVAVLGLAGWVISIVLLALIVSQLWSSGNSNLGNTPNSASVRM